jgi:TetR/AcrR family transcriptional regulator
MPPRKPVSKPRPGRPAQQHGLDARGAIIEAACLLYAQHGIKGSNNKLIAAQAGVTAAMIPYYFKNKTALHIAVLEACFTPLLAGLPDIRTLQQLVHYFHQHLSSRPWLPHLMIREVLTPDGSLLPLFQKNFAPKIFGFFKQLLIKQAQTLKVRADFDIDRHVVLLMGMMVYPFMSMGVAQNLTGRKFDSTMLEGFRDDALKLFLKGITAR